MLSLPTFKNLNQVTNKPQQLSIPIYEITTLDKKMTAFVIPNAIQLSTRQAKYTFASFLSRDTTFDVIYNIWRLARPEDAVSIRSRGRSSMDDPPSATSAGTIGPDGAVGIVAGVAGVQGVVAPLRKATVCACGKAGDHYAETAMDIVIPGTPDRIHNLMFASGFMKDFMAGNQKLLGNDDLFFLFIIVFLILFCVLLRYPNVRLVSRICWIKAVDQEYVLYQASNRLPWTQTNEM